MQFLSRDLEKLSSEDTLNKIKETQCYKKPVLLITSNQLLGSKEMYQEKGFKDTIYKPIKKESLIHEIEEYIKEWYIPFLVEFNKIVNNTLIIL